MSLTLTLPLDVPVSPMDTKGLNGGWYTSVPVHLMVQQGCGVGVVGSRRFLDGVGVGLGLLRILGVGVGIFDPTQTPKVQFNYFSIMLFLFVFISPANLTFDLAWRC